MNFQRKAVMALCALAAASHASAQITLYEGEGFRGRAFTTSKQVADFGRNRLNDRSSSVVVESGRWQVCEDARFAGRCVVLRRGSYSSLEKLGFHNMISSVRPADRRRQRDNEIDAQMDTPDYAWRRRANERVYDAPVTNVRAVMGPPSQHCWVERQQVAPATVSSGNAMADMIAGVLAHQSGANNTQSRDVQRCGNAVSGTPAYWDVTYNFRGQAHKVQMSAAPGATIAVNGKGEPRQ